MRPIVLSLLAGSILLLGQSVSMAQNLYADYVRNVPRQYGPRDPWKVGHVLRHQAGWGGHFYNCDCEEHKRLSPYIRWEQQPTVCCPHGHCWWVRQQIDEVGQRIRTGACLQSEFCLCPQCRSSEPPITPTCPDESGGCCPSCGPTEMPNGAPGELTPANGSEPNQWLGRLYGPK